MTEKLAKLFPTLVERFPEPDDTDMALRLLRAAIASIPMLGGTANELLSMVLTPGVMRFRDEWLKELANLVEKLESKVEGLNPKKLAENDQFVSATIQATRIAIATHQREKREMLRNALFNVATGKGPRDDLQQIFFNAIEGFSPSHVKILKTLHTGLQELSKRSLISGMKTYEDVFNELLPELQSQQSLVQCVLTDLRNRGFSTLPEANISCRNQMVVTNLGIDFLRFVRDPLEQP